MAIKNTELVTLNGSISAFGGKIYNVDYQIGFNENVSTVRLSIFNESGSYNINEGDLRAIGNPDEIQVGDRNLKMYPVEWSYDRSESGKILVVEYQDPSIIFLDKKFVALRGTHTNQITNSPLNAVIAVGQKYYSETFEQGGVVFTNLTTTPPNIIDLGQSLYTLSELYSAMVAHGIPMSPSVENVLLNKKGATTFLNNVVGTLRSSLLAWANIMAFAFYWSENNELVVLDLESSIGVNKEKLKNIRTFSDEEVYSLKDTVDRGYAMYYGKAGRTESFQRNPQTTTKSFFRAIRELNNTEETGLQNMPSPYDFIRAAVLGEEFFTLYSLWRSLNNSGIRRLFGISNLTTLNEEQRKFVDPKGEFPPQQFGFIKFNVDDSAPVSFANFSGLIETLLTYEASLSMDDFERFTTWSRPFTYDIENETEFINSRNGPTNMSSKNHRAFFKIDSSEAFTFGKVSNVANGLANYVDLNISLGKPIQTLGINPSQDIIMSYRLIDNSYQDIINSIEYRYRNSDRLAVKGFRLLGDGLIVVPRVERVLSVPPSFQRNVIAVDMELNTASENEVALAGQLQNLFNILNTSYLREDKSFRKTFSVAGISLPQKIEIEDGLQAISISNTNERGTTSTYTVGNTFFKIPSKEIIMQKLEREKYAEVKANPSFSFVFNRGGFNV